MARLTGLGICFLGCLLCACSSNGAAPNASPTTLGSGGAATGSGGSSGSSDSGSNAALDYDPTADDFKCISDGTKVRNFYITNGVGNLTETLAVANSTTGGRYPVGTVIQLVPFEAMVKRKVGFSAVSNDWEFFSLAPAATGTTIVMRGTTDVVNQLTGAKCLDCHQKAEPQFDFVCEETHGCDPLGLTAANIQALQQGDARCK